MSNRDNDDFFKDFEQEVPETEKPAEKPAEEASEKEFEFSEFFPKRSAEEIRSESYSGEFAPPPVEEEEPEQPVAPPVPEAEDEEPEDDEEYGRREKLKHNRIKNWLVTTIWVAAVLAVSVMIATFALSSINDLVGFSKESREINVTIPENASLSDIAGILKDNGVIDEPFAFEVYARIKKMGDRLTSGTFTLNSNLGYDQLFQLMRSKEGELQTVRITFYEGMKATEIAKSLEENGVCSYDDFMNEVDTASFEYEFENQMSTDKNIYHKWEGFLFPDTYEFYLDVSARSVLIKFIDNFNNKITADDYARMQEIGMSLEDLITMASVVQSEAALEEDMKLVASAFYNRLEEGSGLPNLQSDVTYFYYRDEIEPYVADDVELDEAYHTSYDTYYKTGLPVGPICNPGKTAINAVLYPADSNYYYFVTDTDGNFYYAETHEQHEQNIIAAGRG